MLYKNLQFTLTEVKNKPRLSKYCYILEWKDYSVNKMTVISTIASQLTRLIGPFDGNSWLLRENPLCSMSLRIYFNDESHAMAFKLSIGLKS